MRIRTDHLELVYRIARSMHRRLPRCVELGDLISDGFIGLHEAAKRFDRRRGIPFPRYAQSRIRGAILDGLRTRDWVHRRSARNPVWALSRAKQLNFEPTVTPDECRSPLRDELIAAAIGAIPGRRERLIMHLYFREGLAMRHVARCLGVSQSRISMMLARNLRRIRADENENPAADETAAGS